ncbi:MAG: molybdopterin-dependent oxidoreductase, partial [Acidimicrobiia bacterium]|nr:molybdopterin-dependent oxidoreductase [Acidimicrobiia bacterium]
MFLGMSSLAAFAALFFQRALRPIGNTLARMGIRAPWHRSGPIDISYTTCDMCPWRCGVIVKTVNGVVHKIEGNPNDPKRRGMLCARGQAGVSFLYDPDRLKTPLIRTGERGSGEFREASWDEALQYVADKMVAIRDTDGPEAVAFFGHTSGEFWFTDYLPGAWGSPNAAKPSSSICTSPREEASLLTVGRPIGGHEPVDWDAIQCITLIGSHIGEDSRNTVMQDFAAARDRGARLIAVDPRFSTAAMKSDHWLPIKPGTDTALLLAWINVLITEDLYDADYVAEWTTGFEELTAHVSQYTPAWAAGITDLTENQIRETAREMARHAPQSAIVPGRHVTWYGNDTQRMRAVYIVNALLGAWGRRGGLYLNKSPYLEAYPHPPFLVEGGAGGCSAEPGEEGDDLPPGPTGKTRADGARTKFLRGPTAIQELIDPMITGDPYPIRGLVVYGVNLLHTIPNPERTKEALRNLDLVVAIDVLPQDHVDWADVVLPEATYLERHDELWALGHKTPYIALREPAVEPLHNTKPGWWMARELGLKLGLDSFFRWEDATEWIDKRLISVGSSAEKLHAAGGIIVQE